MAKTRKANVGIMVGGNEQSLGVKDVDVITDFQNGTIILLNTEIPISDFEKAESGEENNSGISVVDGRFVFRCVEGLVKIRMCLLRTLVSKNEKKPD